MSFLKLESLNKFSPGQFVDTDANLPESYGDLIDVSLERGGTGRD